MSIELIPLTKDGHDTLTKELESLKAVDRPNIIKAIAEARAQGDLRENAEYHAAREKQGFIEGRIADLEDKLSRVQIIDLSGMSPDAVRFGSWVTLQDEDSGETRKYRIVGDLEADIAKYKLSISSPMARAIMGRKEQDLVEIKAPAGKREYVIVKIEY
jgi:transcription elongation factor GreA